MLFCAISIRTISTIVLITNIQHLPHPLFTSFYLLTFNHQAVDEFFKCLNVRSQRSFLVIYIVNWLEYTSIHASIYIPGILRSVLSWCFWSYSFNSLFNWLKVGTPNGSKLSQSSTLIGTHTRSNSKPWINCLDCCYRNLRVFGWTQNGLLSKWLICTETLSSSRG